MRSFIIIVVLSALAACYGAAVLPGEANMFSSFIQEQMLDGWTVENNEEDAAQNRVTMSKGEARDDLIFLFERACYVPATPNDVGRFDVVYYGEPNVSIRRFSISFTWPVPAHIYISGLLSNVGRVRLTSHIGERLQAVVRIYGLIIEDNNES
ncbi:uncharacterized protein LOC111350881 [Spodoptera litura]|uniref:Uncharacterized protein LOC111350881 n=1 Tax=Spodoptera litura TaxID=69820 RepID=A0A9J7DXC9_SPOLT|nr:uncharacterized protein LOC111350881 [Spodoptera litura]